MSNSAFEADDSYKKKLGTRSEIRQLSTPSWHSGRNRLGYWWELPIPTFRVKNQTNMTVYSFCEKYSFFFFSFEATWSNNFFGFSKTSSLSSRVIPPPLQRNKVRIQNYTITCESAEYPPFLPCDLLARQACGISCLLTPSSLSVSFRSVSFDGLAS